MQRISIVGGSGFIGTRLCKRLTKRSYEFEIIDKVPSATFPHKTHLADVRTIDTLRKSVSNESILVNLAAEHRDDVRPIRLYDEVNVGGAKNLCQIAREKNIQKILFTSSVAVYGFAPANTDETGAINPFNDYGRTKWLAEQVFRDWQAEDVQNRSLVIVRPTVVFGEQNRGNVYNLLRQIASGRFVMIGKGTNRKSMAYVENVAAFLEHMLEAKPGLHIYNYIDKPDFDMNTLVQTVREGMSKDGKTTLHLPYALGIAAGIALDGLARVTGKTFPISQIRVKKFCATTQFATSAGATGFLPPTTLREGLQQTVRYEFLEDHRGEQQFLSE